MRHLLDLGNQYSAFTYLQKSLPFAHTPSGPSPSGDVNTEDQVVVMAKMESENTDWVAKELPSFVNLPCPSYFPAFSSAD